MLSNVSFCSLDEAWGRPWGSDGVNPPPEEKVVIDINKSTREINEDDKAILSEKKYNIDNNPPPTDNIKRREYTKKLILEDEGKKGGTCIEFMRHLETCTDCQRLLKHKFNNNNNFYESFQNINQNNYPEILMTILMGIFLIFILDAFLKIGKFT